MFAAAADPADGLACRGVLEGAGVTAPLFELRDIRKFYNLRQGLLARLRHGQHQMAAVDGVSLSVAPGEIFGLVGESGCGKSTLAQIMVRLMPPSSGKIFFRGQDVEKLAAAEKTEFRHRIQMVFQDSSSSLNPRKRIGKILGEALQARGAVNDISALMAQVGLDAAFLGRLPHELSGGQRQRVGIARALAMAPDLLVADEPVSSLDVSLQGQIINLLQALNRDLGLTIVLISHDLAVVARVCHRIGVMQAGKIVESGVPGKVLVAPDHAYTRALLSAVPKRTSEESRSFLKKRTKKLFQ